MLIHIGLEHIMTGKQICGIRAILMMEVILIQEWHIHGKTDL